MEEIWRDIEGYEKLYQVSTLGRVKSLGRMVPSKNGSFRKEPEKLLKPQNDRYGYQYVILCNCGNRKKCLVHRLVAQSFIPNPNHYSIINHINKIRDCNVIENLEWCTEAYNVRYSCSIPIIQFSKNGKIIKVWSAIRDVEKEQGIHHSHISDCCKNKNGYITAGGYKWKYLDDYLADWLETYQDECMEKEKAA